MVVPPQAGVPREPRWHLAMAALGHDDEAEPTLRLLAMLGPVEAQTRLVGEPPVTSTRWRARGVEVVLHDGVMVAVTLHLPQADLRTWAGVGNDATLGDLERAFAGKARFAGLVAPYVKVEGGYARFAFSEDGWKARGNLRAVMFVAQRPGESPNPEADDCPTCADLPVHDGAGLDAPATMAALAAALASGRLDLDPGADRDDARATLAGLKGIGPWTVEMVAMRSLGDPDAFPATDLGVRRGAAKLGLADVAAASRRWQPWRAYATQYLWAVDDHPINHLPKEDA